MGEEENWEVQEAITTCGTCKNPMKWLTHDPKNEKSPQVLVCMTCNTGTTFWFGPNSAVNEVLTRRLEPLEPMYRQIIEDLDVKEIPRVVVYMEQM